MSNVRIGADVLTSVVSFMQGADAIIEKQASLEDAVFAEGESVIDSLIEANIIDEGVKSASMRKLKESPVYAFELLKRAAEAMQEPEVGGRGVEVTKKASFELSADDAFENALL